jgi:hypothetical protein
MIAPRQIAPGVFPLGSAILAVKAARIPKEAISPLAQQPELERTL